MRKLFVILLIMFAVPAFAAEDVIEATGAKTFTATLAASAVVDNGDGTVKLTTAAAHGFLAPSVLYVTGTTNYDGMRTVTSIPTVTTLNIKAPYVAETPGGTETVSLALYRADGETWELTSFEIHLSAASATSEDLTINKDDNAGAAWDVNLLTKDMDTVKDYVRQFDPPWSFEAKDVIQFAWSNSDSRTWGVTIRYRRVD
jgi:hypothetical protein